jgi:lipopolysaccharide export system permease protein
MRFHIRPLDRYVFAEFAKIFATTVVGFPLLVILFDLTDNIDTYLMRNLELAQIAMSYVYWLPDTIFLILPAAVLFATVFSIGSLTRHSEITAAKASGISFYRIILPIVWGAAAASVIGLVLGELAPYSNKKRQDVIEAHRYASSSERYNFAYSADQGRVYKVGALRVADGSIQQLQVERRGAGPDYPSFMLVSPRATHEGRNGWLLEGGVMHIIPDESSAITFTFDSARARWFRERPIELTTAPKAPAEMRFRELGRFITAMERSGADVNQLRVERMLKIAVPVTCVVILLFGAPLATSTQRGGAAYGIGISLLTTIVFLMLVQLTRAVGGKGLLTPELAAWMPSIVFAGLGTLLMLRVRT